jgi:hypothetical protein
LALGLAAIRHRPPPAPQTSVVFHHAGVAICSTMGRHILLKCPSTGMQVQHWLADEPSEAPNSYRQFACPACARITLSTRRPGSCLARDRPRPTPLLHCGQQATLMSFRHAGAYFLTPQCPTSGPRCGRHRGRVHCVSRNHFSRGEPLSASAAPFCFKAARLCCQARAGFEELAAAGP